MRLLLDTNVLVAAFVSHGMCAELLEYAAKRHILITSRPLLKEFQTVLTRKFKQPASEAAEAAGLLAMECFEVQPARLGRAVCRDPDDDVVLATAVAGGADAIITGDRDLLVLRRFHSVRIVSPSDFWSFERE